MRKCREILWSRYELCENANWPNCDPLEAVLAATRDIPPRRAGPAVVSHIVELPTPDRSSSTANEEPWRYGEDGSDMADWLEGWEGLTMVE
ncbi:hypothetical protein BGZ80_003581 [Entomortierella chlamydospora]|uniref:Uncharacterized protein n=1 Tax=Entomortierella chlamydospora TaxID=101097 RepID=A0A9P6MN86_9FUNG|nr:hypothetical protein BGZ80_003581 [Entomortierella chlamydospora]